MNPPISSFLLPITCFNICKKNGERSFVKWSIVQYVHKFYSSFPSMLFGKMDYSWTASCHCDNIFNRSSSWFLKRNRYDNVIKIQCLHARREGNINVWFKRYSVFFFFFQYMRVLTSKKPGRVNSKVLKALGCLERIWFVRQLFVFLVI